MQYDCWVGFQFHSYPKHDFLLLPLHTSTNDTFYSKVFKVSPRKSRSGLTMSLWVDLLLPEIPGIERQDANQNISKKKPFAQSGHQSQKFIFYLLILIETIRIDKFYIVSICVQSLLWVSLGVEMWSETKQRHILTSNLFMILHLSTSIFPEI